MTLRLGLNGAPGPLIGSVSVVTRHQHRGRGPLQAAKAGAALSHEALNLGGMQAATADGCAVSIIAYVHACTDLHFIGGITCILLFSVHCYAILILSPFFCISC